MTDTSRYLRGTYGSLQCTSSGFPGSASGTSALEDVRIPLLPPPTAEACFPRAGAQRAAPFGNASASIILRSAPVAMLACLDGSPVATVVAKILEAAAMKAPLVTT